jgi:hypothetical protein
MAKIIRLHDDPHEQAQRLLPWYANHTLDAGEAAAVEAHLAGCAECRADLEAERALALQVANLKVDAGSGWEAMRERIESRGPRAARGGAIAMRPFLGRPVPLGWALAAQVAIAVAVFGLSWSPQQTASDPAYHALGAKPAAVATGNVIVIFRPDTPEAAMRDTLVHSRARLIDGPTASNAYVLRVDPQGRSAAIAALRASQHVVLAEAIDADAPQ